MNGPHGDDAAAASADGRSLFFVFRPRRELRHLRCRREAADRPWGNAEKLGKAVNSRYAEFRPWLSADGLRMTFNSLRPPGEMVWVCTRPSLDAEWSPAVPSGTDGHRRSLGGATFSADGRTAFVGRFARDFPGDLLWWGKVEAGEPFAHLVGFGPTVNGPYIDTSPAPSADGRTVYFQSNRPKEPDSGHLADAAGAEIGKAAPRE